MSIHAFHSKLTSGNEEGTLFEALRRLRSIGKAALSSGEAEGWSYWTEDPEDIGATADGWAWQHGSAAVSRA